MKYTIHHVLIATVIVAAPTIATVRPIDATVITDFSTIATSSFEAICAVKRDDNDIFERSIADQVRLFTGSMKYMLTGTTLDSVVQHKYLEIVAPAKPVEDEQSFELLKKRAWKQREQTLGRTPISVTIARARPCKELQGALRIFNRGLQKLVYSTAERCGGKCAPDGLVSKAITELHDVYTAHGGMGGFVRNLRDAERNVRCNYPFQQSELDINEYSFNKVGGALKAGVVPFGLRVSPCKDMGKN